MRIHRAVPAGMLFAAVLLFTQAASAYVTAVKVEDRGPYIAVRYYNVNSSGTRASVESVDCIRKSDIAMVSLVSHEERLQLVTVRVFIRNLDATERPAREYVFMSGGEAEARALLDELARVVFKP